MCQNEQENIKITLKMHLNIMHSLCELQESKEDHDGLNHQNFSVCVCL